MLQVDLIFSQNLIILSKNYQKSELLKNIKMGISTPLKKFFFKNFLTIK